MNFEQFKKQQQKTNQTNNITKLNEKESGDKTKLRVKHEGKDVTVELKLLTEPRLVFNHFNRIDNTIYNFNCRKTLDMKEDCPICTYAGKVYNNYDRQAPENKWWRAKRYVCNVYVVSHSGDKEQEGQVLIWEFGKSILDRIIAGINNEEMEVEPLNWTTEEGTNNFKLVLGIKDEYNNYDNSMFKLKKTPLTEKEQKEIFEKLYDIDKLYFHEDNFKEPGQLQIDLDKILTGTNVRSFANQVNNTVAGATVVTTAIEEDDVPDISNLDIGNLDELDDLDLDGLDDDNF